MCALLLRAKEIRVRERLFIQIKVEQEQGHAQVLTAHTLCKKLIVQKLCWKKLAVIPYPFGSF